MSQPSIPKPESRSFGNRVKEGLERLLGSGGDPLDGAVTFRDLLQIGVITKSGSGQRGGSGLNGGSPGLAQVVGEPQFSLTPPPAPSATTISVAFFRALIEWDIREYGNHAYSEVWRAATDDLGAAVLHQRITGKPHALAEVSLQYGESWYYWVRLVSRAGIPGPWHSTSGLLAVGPANVLETLDEIGESIDLTYLDPVVGDEIGKISGLEERQGVRLNVNGYVTGYVQNNDGESGDFAILADRFVVLDPAGGGQSPTTPFAVSGGTVYIADAAIRNASIVDAKIANLAADKIVTGTMSANRIFGGTISGNNVNIQNLSASSIDTGTLNAERINLDGLTLENSGGQLRVKNGGVDTGQLVDNAVSVLAQGSDPDDFFTSAGNQTWQTVCSATITSVGKPIRIQASTLIERLVGTSATGCYVRVLRGGVDVTYSTNSKIYLWGTEYTNPWAVTFPDQPGAGSHTYTLQVKEAENLVQLFLTHPTITVDEFKK